MDGKIILVEKSNELSHFDYHADKDPVEIYIKSLGSLKSQRVIRTSLRNVLSKFMRIDIDNLPDRAENYFDWTQIKYQHVQTLRTELMANGYKPATINLYLASLRGVIKECWRLEMIDVETYHRIKDVKNVKNLVLPKGRDVPRQDLKELFMQCTEDGIIGIRDAAIIGILVTCGLRRVELASIDMKDYTINTGAIKVMGKGHKERIVYARNDAKKLLDKWIDVRGYDDGALFRSIRKGDKVSDRRFTASSIYKMISKRSIEAGLDKTTPHDFRRTLIGNLLDLGVDEVTIMKITGHASSDMLKRYDRRDERAKIQAADQLGLPI